MTLQLTAEQVLLEESLDGFVERHYSFDQRQAIVASEDGWSRALWHQFAELGWLGAGIPEASGGLGGGPVEQMLIAKAFGKAMVLEPFVSTAVAGARILTESDNAEVAGALLSRLVDGDLIVATAFAEHGARYDLHQQRSRATASGNAFVLDGEKATVFDGHAADAFIVAARLSGDVRERAGIGLFLVDASAAGLECETFRTMDGSGAAHLRLANCSAQLLVSGHRGHEVLENAVALAISARCAQACGAMQASLSQSVAYLKTREQFGVPISSFQVISHRLVDLLIASTECQAMALMTATKLADAGLTPGEHHKAAAAAKAFVGKRARRTAQEIVQMHGGIGMTEEYAIGHYFRYLTAFCTAYGSTIHHLERYADAD